MVLALRRCIQEFVISRQLPDGLRQGLLYQLPDVRPLVLDFLSHLSLLDFNLCNRLGYRYGGSRGLLSSRRCVPRILWQ